MLGKKDYFQPCANKAPFSQKQKIQRKTKMTRLKRWTVAMGWTLVIHYSKIAVWGLWNKQIKKHRHSPHHKQPTPMWPRWRTSIISGTAEDNFISWLLLKKTILNTRPSAPAETIQFEAMWVPWERAWRGLFSVAEGRGCWTILIVL